MQQPENMDLSRMKHADTSKYSMCRHLGYARRGTAWKRRIALYSIVLLVIGGLLVWQHHQEAAIDAARTTQQTDDSEASARQALAALAASATNARDLATAGMTALQNNQPTVASYLLEAASEKEPQFRDAAVYAGYAELKLADAAWPVDAAVATAHTYTALHYLAIAQAIDPIHAYTFELIALAHENLGETDKAATATQKARFFALDTTVNGQQVSAN